MSTQETVEITSSGIRKFLNKYTPERAISEYISNGFDALATQVNVDFIIGQNDFGTFKTICISDNGNGICYEDLSKKFKQFYESQKALVQDEKNNMLRGKNGYGRLTFFKFASAAKWSTTYLKENETLDYDITINSDNLKNYNPTAPAKSKKLETGTTVEFNGISTELSIEFIEKVLKPYLRAEFAWYLELKKECKILINGEELDYSSIIAEIDDFPIDINDDSSTETFQCKYIRWNNKINDEFSRFYFLNSKFELKNTKTTRLNKKGDDFWHSVIVVNDFFDEINTEQEDEENTNGQTKLFEDKKDSKVFKDLIDKLNDYLKDKRRPFLKKQAEILITKYEQEKVMPTFGENDWDKVREDGFKSLVKEMYEVEPAIFTKLNKEQKRIFLEMLNLVCDSSERDSFFKILEAVIELDSKDRTEFAKILETTRLKQVISTLKLITDRILTLENLKKLVFKHELKANEVNHLQTFIEKHYWIFGEQHRMVCSAEVKFENALNKYLYILRGVTEREYLKHPDKYKEMDLFLAGTDFRDGKPSNVVVEIKSPSTIKRLKSENLNQLEKYLDVILKEDCFNDMNEEWTFMLIGQDYDDIIGRRIQNKQTGLVQTGDNYSLYVKKWSEIVNEVERRLKYLMEKLQIEREKLTKRETLKEVMESVQNNTAIMN